MTLSMHGTVWERLLRRGAIAGGHDELSDFFRQIERGARNYDLGEDSVYLAQELVRMGWSLGGSQQRALALLVLASLVSVRQGSTRLPLGGGVGGHLGQLVGSILSAAGMDTEVSPILRQITALARSTTFDRLVGGPGEYRPFVVAHGCIYQHRMYLAETRLCERIGQRLRRSQSKLGAGDPAMAVADVVSRPSVALSEEQLAAIRRAVDQPFTVISGGPGTGKTAAVVSLLRVAARLGLGMDQIALAAPTGKAAQRMAVSIRAGLAAVSDPTPVDVAIAASPPEPQTLHRLLGYMPGVDRFRHHDNHPLAAAMVVVDEASMIDLAMMDRLFAATSRDARLVLIGDADQLPSVDAGCVLRDLSVAGAEFAQRLTQSYRMNPNDPQGRAIYTAAGEINAGRADALSRGNGGALTRVGATELPTFLADWYTRRIADQPGYEARIRRVYRRRGGHITDNDAREIRELLAIFERSRLLAVTRRMPTGSDAINRRLHQLAIARHEDGFAPDLGPGEPIVVRANDYERSLFNGDQGVILRVADDDDRPRLRAVFARGDDIAVFNVDALRANVDLAYAITVHRSQGSEHDEVALILPARDVPILTRELIYTAVTRARRAVTIVGDAGLLQTAVHRRIQRFSGIADRLAAAPRARP